MTALQELEEIAGAYLTAVLPDATDRARLQDVLRGRPGPPDPRLLRVMALLVQCGAIRPDRPSLVNDVRLALEAYDADPGSVADPTALLDPCLEDGIALSRIYATLDERNLYCGPLGDVLATLRACVACGAGA